MHVRGGRCTFTHATIPAPLSLTPLATICTRTAGDVHSLSPLESAPLSRAGARRRPASLFRASRSSAPHHCLTCIPPMPLQETCIIVPRFKVAFDSGRCPQRAAAMQTVLLTHGVRRCGTWGGECSACEDDERPLPSARRRHADRTVNPWGEEGGGLGWRRFQRGSNFASGTSAPCLPPFPPPPPLHLQHMDWYLLLNSPPCPPMRSTWTISAASPSM